MNKIIKSLSVIAFVGALALGLTGAYFSDTETSTGNLFQAGTIDIHVIGDNFVWEESAILEDMKPCYTDYINFTIYNDDDCYNPNPVNVWKHLIINSELDGFPSEPECTDQGGTWMGYYCDWGSIINRNNISSIIDYDLIVWVYDENDDLIWWQTIYDKEVTVADIKCNDIYLGMIPVGGYMKVEQSYHMQDPNEPTNWAQGDVMNFDIEIKGIQLRGEAWLENKDESQDWKIVQGDGIEGTLTYEVKHPTFDFDFTGKAPLANHDYILAIGYDANTNVDTTIGAGTTDANGDITITGDVELNSDMKDVKVWLITAADYNPETGAWSGYSPNNYLWETGLIWYEDTDL